MKPLNFFKIKKLSTNKKDVIKPKKTRRTKKTLRFFSFLKNMKIAPRILLGFAVIAKIFNR